MNIRENLNFLGYCDLCFCSLILYLIGCIIVNILEIFCGVYGVIGEIEK